MTDDLTATWRLVDSVRDRCYDLFTHAEKKRLHDLVVMLKSTGTISASDRQWLGGIRCEPARDARANCPCAPLPAMA
jgi:hypothetical protein